MNKNSEVITVLCSHLCTGDEIKPLTSKEWGRLASILMAKHLQPENLLHFNHKDFISELNCSDIEAERLIRLIDRSASIQFELSKYEDIGIRVITRADVEYPNQLKKKLKITCPPLFYCIGNLQLLSKPSIGFVGSRKIEQNDVDFTQKIVTTTAKKGYSVVSGGARGIDTISASTAASEGTAVIEYISDSMLHKLRDAEIMKEIRARRLLLLSAVVPTTGFSIGAAMMRNRYIYAQSNATIVIRSDKGKGGTWAGATENLKNKWCPIYCRDYNYPGNRELIRMGAIPVNEDWDGNIGEICKQSSDLPIVNLHKTTPYQSVAKFIAQYQTSLF